MAFTGTFGGYPLYDAATELANAREAAKRGLPYPALLERANSMTVLQGPEPPRGWILMRRGDLDAMGLDKAQTLQFTSDSPASEYVYFKGLYIVKEPQAVIPGYIADDPAGVCLVEVSDVTYLLKHLGPSLNKQYNVRAPAYQGAYVVPPQNPSATLASGGSLSPTTFYYKITATNPYGETTGSTEVSATCANPNFKITLAWTASAGATGYKIYRGTSAGAENLLVQTINSGATVTWTDDGTETTSSASPPGSNTAADQNSWYYDDSLDSSPASNAVNGKAPWTWTRLVQDLWTTCGQLGAYGSLPFSPDGIPEGFIFQGVMAYDALNYVLARIGCALLRRLGGPTYSIIQIGAADAAVDAAITLAISQNRKIYDAEFQAIIAGKVPASVTVYFHRREAYGGIEQTAIRTTEQWSTNCLHGVTIAGPDSASVAGLDYPLFDDLPALYDETGALTNAAALTTRATERANDFYRMLTGDGGDRLWQRFSGLINTLGPSDLKAVRWACFGKSDGPGEGTWTEIIRHPYLQVAISDSGEIKAGFEEACKLHAPFLRPTWPVYPLVEQILKLNSGTPTSGYYDALIEHRQPSAGSWADKESVWGLDLAGATSLTSGNRYLARLEGFANGRPVYAFNSYAGDSVINNLTVQNLTVTNTANFYSTTNFYNPTYFNSTVTFNYPTYFNSTVTFKNTTYFNYYAIFNYAFAWSYTSFTFLSSVAITLNPGTSPKLYLVTPTSAACNIQAITPGIPGQVLILWNDGPGPVILQDLKTGAAGDILCPNACDYQIEVDNAVILEYDATGANGTVPYGVWRFDHPTFRTSTAGGNAGTVNYQCQDLRAGANITLTSLGNGVTSIAATQAASTGADYNYWTHAAANEGATRYYWAGRVLSPNPTQANPVNANCIIAIPFITPRGGSIDLLGIRLLQSASSAQNVRLAIYDNKSATDLYPNNLLFDSGDLSATAVAPVNLTANPNLTLTAGAMYWLCFQTSTFGTPSAAAWACTTSNQFSLYPYLGIDPTISTSGFGWFVSRAYAAYPATFPAGASVLSSANTGQGWQSGSWGVPIEFVHFSA